MELSYKFIGWCKEGTSDKVWGAIQLEGRRAVTFWGRRGKALQTKLVNDDWDLSKLVDQKRRKGYCEVNRTGLDRVYPGFQEDLEKTAVWAILSAS